jgi:hypothetical protein
MVYVGTNDFSLDGGLLNDGQAVKGFFTQDAAVAIDLGGGSGGGGTISGGGGGTITISNEPGLANSNLGKLIYIQSSIDGCSIIRNGANTFATTNNSITLTTEELVIQPVSITLNKTGYKFNDEYIFDVVTNPNYIPYTQPLSTIKVDPYSSLYGYQDFNNLPNLTFGELGRVEAPSGVTFYGQPYIPNTGRQDVYSAQPGFVMRVRHLINGVEQVFNYDAGSSSITIKFDNNKPEVKDIVLDPPVLPTLFKVSINLNGIGDSIQVLATNAEIKTIPINLQAGVNNFEFAAGTKLIVSTTNAELYRLSKITSNNTVETIVTEAQSQLESISGNIDVNSNLTIDVDSETVVITPINYPSISFSNEEELKKAYNKNSNAHFPIGLLKSSNTTSLIAYVNKESIEYQLNQGETSATIVIPHNYFSQPGQYKIIFVPSSNETPGDSIQFILNVVDDVYVGTPDIRNIRYPSLLKGPDFVGTDVDFSIEYETINTDELRLYAVTSNTSTQLENSNFMQIACKQNGITQQTFNFKSLLENFNISVSEDDDLISLSLKLVPVNKSGREVVVGDAEYISIKFDKGDLTIPKEIVVSRIADGFISQFDMSIFDDETSKYLTHLAHFGNGDNKVITTWVEDDDSLILKLYEPLPTTVQTNQEIWISKLQANPIIETITLSSEEELFCPPLKGPNFSIEADSGIGYQLFSDLVGSGSFAHSQLVNKISEKTSIDTEKLNITYVSGSDYSWENFVHYGSGTERINNFYYKIKTLEVYQTKYFNITGRKYIVQAPLTGSKYGNFEAHKLSEDINNLISTFDGFETYLYKNEDTLAYPKENYTDIGTGVTYRFPKSSTSNDAVGWYESAISYGENYDKYNVNALKNNIPEYLTNNNENDDFILFLDMIGQHFDIIWSYINSLKSVKKLEHKQEVGIPNTLIYSLLESLGWKSKKAFDSQFLWEYMFGTDIDGSQKYSRSLQDANFEVWRRIANNLPYLLKHKGTARAMKAIMACYGVPQSMLTIMEFGGPQDPTTGGVTQFTFDDRTAAIRLDEDSSIRIPWHTSSLGILPDGIEFRIKPDVINPVATLISGSEWTLDLIQTTGSFCKLELNFGGNDSTSTYILEPYISASVSTYYFNTSNTYVFGPDLKSGSLDFPMSTQHYSNVAINRTNYANSSSLYEVWLATSDGQRIVTSVSMSILYNDNQWETGSTQNLVLGGNGYEGNIDEFRLWTVPLQRSKFENHTLFPDAINGNSYTASTSDLIFRLDFEYPKDRTNDNNIKNVSINNSYNENFAYAQNFYSASTYPYQYTPYDRTVTANVPSLGLTYGNKIRFESQELVGNLSHKVRATKKAFDRAPIDSNRLGLFFSPIKELNMDILKSFGDFSIDNYIGDPRDEYKDSYGELEKLREYYFQRLQNRNIYEYIRLVRYIDKSLFDVLTDLAPARAIVSKGLLIEPHFLERSKVRWDKPESLKNDYDSTITTSDNNKIELELQNTEGVLNTSDIANLISDLNSYESLIDESDSIILESTNPNYEGLVQYDSVNILETEFPTYPNVGSVHIECPTGASLIGEVEGNSITAIGMDKNSLANIGFGLYAKHGNSVYRQWDDLFGNLETTGSRVSVFLVKETKFIKQRTQISGYPATTSGPIVYDNIVTSYEKYNVSILPFSGSVNVGGGVTEVTAINGYLPTHYKFVNGLGEGMQRSFWKGSQQTAATTPDGLSPVETFTTNPNILRVAKTGRGSGEPILEVD